MRLMPCPACPAQLQPLEPASSYANQAWVHARALELQLPEHGPAMAVFLALVSHAMVVHDELDLAEYLEAYLGS